MKLNYLNLIARKLFHMEAYIYWYLNEFSKINSILVFVARLVQSQLFIHYLLLVTQIVKFHRFLNTFRFIWIELYEFSGSGFYSFYISTVDNYNCRQVCGHKFFIPNPGCRLIKYLIYWKISPGSGRVHIICDLQYGM
jgi:hypothetical protein